MTLDELKAVSEPGKILELGRKIFGDRRAGQIYRYLADPKTGRPGRIPPPEVMARIYIETNAHVQPGDFYKSYIADAIRENRRRAVSVKPRKRARGRPRAGAQNERVGSAAE